MYAAFPKNDIELKRIEQLISSGDLGAAASSLNALQHIADGDPRIHTLGAQLGLAAKNPEAALRSTDIALSMWPDWPYVLFLRASALERLNRIREAFDATNAAAERAPTLLPAVELSVILGRRLGELDTPEALLRAAHAAQPENPVVWLGLGNFLSRHKKEESIAWFEKLLAAAPENLDALLALAAVFIDLGRLDEATALIARAEKIAPGDPAVQFHASRIRGGEIKQIPEETVRALFDEYADRYNSHLLSRLGYRVPQLVGEKIKKAFPSLELNILDLGCGSGLLGQAVGPINGYFIGVDLSANMLQKAAQVGVYHRLHHVDLHDALEETAAEEYEVIAACDVLVYIADPEPFVRDSSKVLRSNGILYFTCEAALQGEANVVVRATQRYAQNADWIKALCERHGFTHVEIEPINIRIENDQPVQGFLVTAKKT